MDFSILDLHGFILFATLFLMLIGGAIGLPIPEDVPLLLAGIIASNTPRYTYYLFLTCYSGIILGDLIVFALGWYLGPKVLKLKPFSSKLGQKRIARIKIRLERRSLLMIFIARHLFYLRSITFLLCGAVKMHPLRFVAADATAALVSVPIMMTIGYFAAEHYDKALRNYRIAAVILTILFIIFLFFYFKKKKAATHS